MLWKNGGNHVELEYKLVLGVEKNSECMKTKKFGDKRVRN